MYTDFFSPHISTLLPIVWAGALFLSGTTPRTLLEEDTSISDAAQPDIGSLRFFHNKGQAPDSIRFHAEGAGHTVLFSADAVTWNRTFEVEDGMFVRSNMTLRFRNALEAPSIEGVNLQPGLAHFYRGSDPSDWHTRVPSYGRILYRGLYPGIDLLYLGDGGRFKSKFHVAPQANPAVIELDYAGTDSLYIRDDGALVLDTPVGSMIEDRPYVYQIIGPDSVVVQSRYLLTPSGTVMFELGDYDTDFLLVIDPELTFATYLGGADEDLGNAGATDANGNIYTTGFTASNDFPTQDPIRTNPTIRIATSSI